MCNEERMEGDLLLFWSLETPCQATIDFQDVTVYVKFGSAETHE
jgi:hypothetical protein